MSETGTNKQTEKPNYQKLLEAELDRIRRSAGAPAAAFEVKKPSLLLHACCAPCSSYVVEYLSAYFTITIFYYNPNIHPQAEYERRRDELSLFILNFPPASRVQLHIPPYDPEEYFHATKVRGDPVLEAETERGERCRRCYRFRMKRAFTYAAAHGFDYVTTTLSISPYKDAENINVIGRELESEFQTLKTDLYNRSCNATISVHAPRYLYADFKKKNGFKRSLELSAEYGLYRQDYCGCIYSLKEGAAGNPHYPTAPKGR